MEKQTAGHDQLGDFAPQFAELNDDVLFGQVWAREDQLSPRDRSLITMCSINDEWRLRTTQISFATWKRQRNHERRNC